MPMIPITCTINGETVEATVSTRDTLADLLRDTLGLTATHVGCEHGVCGACTILFDGRTARACLVLAAQADGAEIETLEGATASGRIAALQKAFHDHAALQCGFCTPGMLLAAAEFLEDHPAPSRAEIREALSGNLCRCTGYQAIVDAVAAVAKGTEP
ncbi:(2Fe-2S)-binding protein [Rhodoplanes sp. TEM]|uniref:(2Fe-2S)-binding protein n=1 Tax=Rhodoplanes tepidamans TaxID=200616 RepID=A0ABT5JAT6_RHOTP|nr:MULTISPECIES: (2Fe-2S)-binding protein [Rhodoplanes]MDC7786774.1 (2Fe-2S)-binding protein [Rhodoplanes tepidamans]MDC7987460.1 (2Fe-2S)-binding protein [Rhodoplanes sp. TEM]MDQ0356329.1 carbon-monoxide dehydrogenase small subunit [Rhodoplanes tepidamans]